ncbi:transglycosylase SLT domain-containing protein [Spiribacter halobius]|uniref:Lytic murein transglycosylase n=1 Tax=Sediminicurvatus halobius TaxID=2182432 RepID=A0A2U2MYY9_9GAMM|nr:transglycosylase SLT domain-containing protein [Spiribacter halobius]PWG62022.1 hypothetical protein DEM34_13635 [Spiribacter halobius]UEX78717.1 transglycosylase SLT domain-containing protein [Spiribacter halobius]
MRTVATTLASVLLAMAGMAAAASPAEQYRAGVRALEAGDTAAVDAARKALAGEPIRAYLDYAVLRAELEEASPARVNAFLDRHADLAVTQRLRVAWLRELARREDWAALRSRYAGERDVHVRCALVEAHRQADDHDSAARVALALWHVGYRQPGACNDAFDYLHDRGELTAERLRARMLLALEAGNPGLARAYRDRLPTEQQRWLDHWLTVWSQPAKARGLEPKALGPAAERSRVLVAALERLARSDPEAARDLLPVAERHGLKPRARGRIERTAALWAAYRDHPDGLTWLRALSDADSDEVARAWRVRAALRAGHWPAVRSAIGRMPPEQGQRARWQYWLGRALAAEDRTAAASRAYEGAASEFGYYGFLAADALGRPYRWGQKGPEAASELPALPALVRAQQLHAAGETAYARLEWRAAMALLTPAERLAAARRAQAEDWPWAVMHASGRAGTSNASRLRFPFGFRDSVEAAARQADVDADWLYALIRQESAFGLGRCSHRGACGPAQLMPATARWLLDRDGADSEPLPRVLERPEMNIGLGARYLAHLLGRFDDPVLAIAAYNAGPGSVAGWLEAGSGPPPGSARWIETLPFGETRDYVQAILFNRTVYRLRLTGDTQRLSEVLRADR